MPNTSDVDPVSQLTISDEVTSQSLSFIGQWNQLISTTNWEKGDIIIQWRKSLEQEGAALAEFSDEAWSQLVGGVTPQHVGRLRRTFERFGHVYQEYTGIYWSHFYASLDWDDAEMWLEGAVQNRWSVSKMRHQRWETLGKIPDQEPRDQDVVATEAVEEAQSLELSENKRQNDRDYIEGPVHEGPDFGDEPAGSESTATVPFDEPTTKSEPVRPFESFTDMPDDIAKIVDTFKVAIIRHKAEQWSSFPRQDLLGILDALKQLALTPSE